MRLGRKKLELGMRNLGVGIVFVHYFAILREKIKLMWFLYGGVGSFLYLCSKIWE